MTHTRMVQIIAKETGYPKKMVQHVLDTQGRVMKECLTRQEEIHFPGILKLYSSTQKFYTQEGNSTNKTWIERIVVRVKTMRSFREELRQWISTPL